MSRNGNKKILHLRSTNSSNGSPTLPSSSDLVNGEIAINYGDGVETLAIKNSSNEVVTFSNDESFDMSVSSDETNGYTITAGNRGKTESANIPIATSSQAGVMTAAQAAKLAGAADAADVPKIYDLSYLYDASSITSAQHADLASKLADISQRKAIAIIHNNNTNTSIVTRVMIDGGLLDISCVGANGSFAIHVEEITDSEGNHAVTSTYMNFADNDEVPKGAFRSASALKLVNGNDDNLFDLPAATTTYAGIMSAAQVTALNAKADAATLAVQSTAPATLAPTINTYTRIDSAVGTMSVTLPAISAGTFSALSIAFTSSTTPAVTFTTADSKTIVYASDFAIDGETTYEISALFNGVNWVLAYATFD